MTAARCLAYFAATLLVLSGCAAIQRQQAADAKELLRQAGFRVRLADEPGLPARQLVAQSADGTTVYGVKGDVILHTRLEELYHDASASPGTVKIEVSAELVDATGRLVGERQRFSRSVAANSENAAAAVDAANRAVSTVLDEIAAWIEGSRPRPSAT